MAETPSAVLEPEVLGAEIAVPTITNSDEIETLAQRYAVEAQGDLQMAQACQVTDDASYEQAGALRVAIDRKRKGGEGVVELVCGPLYRRWKDFRALLMAPVDTRAQALKVLSDRRLSYEREQARKAEEARKAAEAAAKAEQDRLDKLAEQRAQRAEAKGDTERAEEIRSTVPQVTAAPIAVAPPAKTKGVSKVTYWRAALIGETEDARRESLLQLVTAVASGEVPLDAILVNESWLNKTAAALKTAMKYPGIRVYSVEQEKSTGR